MTQIGVDSAGHAGQPPIVMVATKTTSKGQSAIVLVVDEAAHSIYENCTDNWREKLTAALVYHTILPIYGPNHGIIIDWDFNILYKRQRVQEYLRHLIGTKFYEQPWLTNPSISFANDSDPFVKHADQKAWLAYHKKGRWQRKYAPNLINDILSL